MNGERSCSQKAEGSKRRFKKNEVTGGRKQRMGMSSEGSQFFSGDHSHAKGTTAKMEGGGYRPKGQCGASRHIILYTVCFQERAGCLGPLKRRHLSSLAGQQLGALASLVKEGCCPHPAAGETRRVFTQWPQCPQRTPLSVTQQTAGTVVAES